MSPITLLILAAAIAIVLALVVWACCSGFSSHAKPKPSAAGARTRRSAGNALLVLDGFLEPKVEHVLTARQQVRQDDEEPGGNGDGDGPAGSPGEAAIEALLIELLGEPRIDCDAIRRHLVEAQRAGLDWRALYQRAVQALLLNQPFRAPGIPPENRVAPRE